MPSLLARTFAGKVVPHGPATHRCLSCSNESVRTNVREKLLKISDEIVARGHANLTRLTVPRPWFERPKRLAVFALWLAVGGNHFIRLRNLLGRPFWQTSPASG